MPVRFLPPDAIAEPGRGDRPPDRRPGAGRLLPARLASAHRRPRAPIAAPGSVSDLHPVEITVSGAGALASAGGGGTRVDVVVAAEPVTGGRARVQRRGRRRAALAIAPAAPEDATVAGADSWSATLALTRRQALELIEAENFAREIRLIPAS